MNKHALIVGATGITGSNLAENLLAEGGWTVSGLSRSQSPIAGVKTLSCDLVDANSVRAALTETRPSHVFVTAWSRQETEAKNCEVNGAIVRNVLDALQRARCRACCPDDGHETLPRPLQILRQDAARDAVPRGAGTPAGRKLLLCAGRRDLCGRCEGRLYLVHSSPAYADRLCGRKRDEHGCHARSLRLHLPGNRPVFCLPRFARAMAGGNGRYRCQAACETSQMGGDDEASRQPRVQCRQRRSVSLEMALAAPCELLRSRSCALLGSTHAAGRADGRRGADLGRDGQEVQSPAERALPRGLILAFGCGSRSPDRDVQRHGPQPQARLSRLSGYDKLVHRRVRSAASGSDHTLGCQECSICPSKRARARRHPAFSPRRTRLRPSTPEWARMWIRAWQR